jgi:DNA-binding HxlR family transcriptional regulator
MKYQSRLPFVQPDAFVEEDVFFLFCNYPDSRIDYCFIIDQYLLSGKYQNCLEVLSMTDCGLDTVLALIGGKWKMLILYHLCHAPRRFGELRRLLPGISEKMLIQDLRQMLESNLLVRKDYQQVPPKVEYSITPFGRSLGKSLAPLCAWGDKNRRRVLGKKFPQKEVA